MTRRIKFLFASVVLALGFFLCLFFLPIGVKAETVEPQPTVTTQEVVNEEVTEQQEEIVEDVKSALAWLKSLDAESVKGWLVGLVVKSGIDVLVLLFFVVKLILSKTKEYKQNKFYQELTTTMDAEHKKKVENLLEEFNTKMLELQGDLKREIAKLDEKKKEEAKNNIEVLKKNLDEIKVDLEKQ